MTQAEFYNALRILYSLDAGDDTPDYHLSKEEWAALLADPPRFYLRADDATQDMLWVHIERRRRLAAAR